MTNILNSSRITVLVILLVVSGWVISGPEKEKDATERPLKQSEDAFTVGFMALTPEKKAHAVKVSAHVAANRSVNVVAEVSGKVTQLVAQRGSAVKKGDLLLRIDERDLPERVKQAEAQLKRRQLETESTRNLFKRDLTNQSAVALAEADLAEAEAILTSIKLDLEATRIRAPFDGIFDQRFVEAGEYVSPGMELVRVIDNRTMLIKGAVSENNIYSVQQGADAFAIMPDGSRVNGSLQYVASSASTETRTYEVEMKVEDSKTALYDGQTATLSIPQGEVNAYLISPALLIITDTAGLGLKVLDKENRVSIVPVEIIEAGTNGIWISGPSPDQRLITVGQGFVEPGDIVNAVENAGLSPKQPTKQPAQKKESDEAAE